MAREQLQGDFGVCRGPEENSMTDFTTKAQHIPHPALGRLRRVAVGPIAAAALVLTFALGLGGGCQSRAGVPCQDQSECTPGLLCTKPPNAGPQGFGICEPGLKGLGERCVRSAECSDGLVCSTDLGEPSDDGWHGACQVGSLPDAGASDLSAAVDLGPTKD